MVSYGGGANSTALLIGLHQHRIPVDLILFADTGAEHPHTYAYLEVMDSWLKDHGMPPITRVYKTTRDGKRLTLEDECLQSCSLPSIAYGFKRCSLKHKIGPQEKFCNHYTPCRRTWEAGKRVVKFIGYDAGEGYRSDKVLLGRPGRPKIQQVVSPDGMGMDAGRLHPADRGGRAAPAGKIVLFFLPQHETRRDHRPAGAASRFVSPRPGAGGQRPEKPENSQGPGAELFLERTIWKGVLHTWQRLRRFAKTSKRRRRRSPPSRSAFGSWRRSSPRKKNLEIVRMVKAVRMDNKELTAFLKAYASGLITLPDGMMEAEAAPDPDDDMEDSDHEE